MRRHRCLLLAGLALPSALFACVSDNNAPAPGGDIDASFPAEDASSFDATMASDTAAAVDARSPQDASDAGAVDSGGSDGAVSILVTTGGTPLVGVTLVFNDSTGAVTGTGTTDGTGALSQVLAPNSQVTALLGSALRPTLVTVVGVQPGDVLNLVDPLPVSFALSENIAVAFPPLSNAVSYQASAGVCNAVSTASPATFAVRVADPNCASGGKFPVLVQASDTNDNLLDFLFANGNVAAAGTDAGLDLTAETWTPFGSLAISATNAPDAGSLYAGLYEVANGVSINDEGPAPQDAGTLLTSVASHPGYADFVQSVVAVSRQVGVATSDQFIATRTAPPGATGSVSFDLAQLLPYVAAASVDTTNTARPKVTWTTSASTPVAAGTLVVFSFIGNDGPDAALVSGGWTLVVPPDVTSVTVPALPASAGTWIPGSPADITGPDLWILSEDGMTTYDQARPVLQPLFAIDPRSFSNAIPLRTSDGTLRMTFFSPH